MLEARSPFPQAPTSLSFQLRLFEEYVKAELKASPINESPKSVNGLSVCPATVPAHEPLPGDAVLKRSSEEKTAGSK